MAGVNDEEERIVRANSEEEQQEPPVISNKEVIGSALVSAFAGILGLSGIIYAAAVAEPQDILRVFGNLLGIGFLICSFIFLLRTCLEFIIFGAAKRNEVKTLQSLILTLIILDLAIIGGTVSIIIWLEIYSFLPVLLLIISFDIWRQKSLINRYFCK